nr:MAG TPA: hypothetical protein [Bacteriophage sp.]
MISLLIYRTINRRFLQGLFKKYIQNQKQGSETSIFQEHKNTSAILRSICARNVS